MSFILFDRNSIRWYVRSSFLSEVSSVCFMALVSYDLPIIVSFFWIFVSNVKHLIKNQVPLPGKF